MTDWEKLKVTELKEELKTRGIPLTGLKLKQQLIDKLIEVDNVGASEDLLNTPNQDNDDVDRSQLENLVLEHDHSDHVMITADDTNSAGAASHRSEPRSRSSSPQLQPSITAEPSHELPTTREEAIDGDLEPSTDDKGRRPSIFIPEEDNVGRDVSTGGDQAAEPCQRSRSITPAAEEDTIEDIDQKSAVGDAASGDHRSTSRSPPQITAGSTRLPTPEVLEDQRKRKRRSLSPPPDTQDSQKRVRRDSGSPTVNQQESEALDAIREATALVQDGRAAGDIDRLPILPMEASDNPDYTKVAKEVGGLPSAFELRSSIDTRPNVSQSDAPVEDRDRGRQVSPALHPTTASLYLRNFKRPLHVPSLRAHILRLAESIENHEESSIKVFYLDTTRTHAFVSFSSMTAATRVRSQMHGVRYPDEPMRDPLWVDYIPDDKVQFWIERETGRAKDRFGPDRGFTEKFEIFYGKSNGTTEATLRTVSDTGVKYAGQQQQQPLRGPRASQASAIEESSTPLSRTGLLSRRDVEREHAGRDLRTKTSPDPSKSDGGTGFKALDELFAFTSVKPKLYYKPAPQLIVDDRLNLLRNLAVAHAGLGRSGDEGMKRYTFDKFHGRQEWVDKGPEFGFGKKGQDRLGGFRGRGRGGVFRGRGRGGDSWRGDP